MRKLTIAGAAAATLLGLLLPAAAHAAPAAAGGHGGGLVVRTDRGLVKGKSAEGIHQWLGIPYATPPAGALRWAAPQPAPRWPGVRQATSYGGRCAQLASGNGPRVDNENCLYLNVYAPPDAGKHALPVLFMIHGGGLTTGAGDQHDGSLIATTDHIIVVSINYRLGPFGFLTIPGLSAGASTANGNFGLLDQEAALRWVQRNIGAFGGNPAKVTIAGESAGGWSDCALLASPPGRPHASTNAPGPRHPRPLRRPRTRAALPDRLPAGRARGALEEGLRIHKYGAYRNTFGVLDCPLHSWIWIHRAGFSGLAVSDHNACTHDNRIHLYIHHASSSSPKL